MHAKIILGSLLAAPFEIHCKTVQNAINTQAVYPDISERAGKVVKFRQSMFFQPRAKADDNPAATALTADDLRGRSPLR